MTLPGTHDTCSKKTWEFAENQTWDLNEQYEAGIRYVDIRCRHINNAFAIHHGMIFCNIFFGDVLKITQEFLSEYDSETIIMRVKEEEFKLNGELDTMT